MYQHGAEVSKATPTRALASLALLIVAMFIADAGARSASAAEPSAWFRGNIYIDAAEAPRGTPVEALIGGLVCGRTRTATEVVPVGPKGVTSFFEIRVAPDAEIPGCGREGVEIRFRVNGRLANEAQTWRPLPKPDPRACANAVLAGDPDRSSCSEPPHIILTVGEPFLMLGGFIRGPGLTFPLNGKVEAFVEGKLCGVDDIQAEGWYWVIVRTEQVQPGCAAPGREVTLRFNGLEAPQRADGAPGFRNLDVTLSSPLPPALAPSETSGGGWPVPGIAAAISVIIAAAAVAWVFVKRGQS